MLEGVLGETAKSRSEEEMKKENEETRNVKITIQKIELIEDVFKIKGITPLLHNDLKARMILSSRLPKKERPKPLTGEAAADYRMVGNGVPCIKGSWIFEGLLYVTDYVTGTKSEAMDYRKILRGTIRVPQVYIPIAFEKRVLSEEVIRTAGIGRQPDIRWRWQYEGWSAEVKILRDPLFIQSRDIIEALLTQSGFRSGVGDWRPQKGGDWGLERIGENGLEGTGRAGKAEKEERGVNWIGVERRGEEWKGLDNEKCI